MKRNGRSLLVGLSMAAVLTGAFGCNKSASNAMTESGSAAAASGAMQAGMSLVNQLGGMSMVTKLADAFGKNLGLSSILSKVLDAGTIAQTKLGLVNEIAKASGMAAPNPGVDLLSTLSGKSLDASGVNEITNALSSAADHVKLGSAQKTAVMGVLAPITEQLLGK